MQQLAREMNLSETTFVLPPVSPDADFRVRIFTPASERPAAKMHLAVVGTRGIPAGYGGFETFAEEISTRLVERGHRVTVYCRQQHQDKSYRGVELQYLPTIRHKYLDTIVHTFLSTFHLLCHRTDAAVYCNAANAVFKSSHLCSIFFP